MASPFLSGALAGLLGFLGLGGPSEPPPAQPPPVSAPVVASAANSVRGTMILLHGGAWRGPDAEHQQQLVREPGTVAVQRGWRVVSVDYKEGQGGLQDVLDGIGQELLRPSGRLLCIYGESAGGQLALVAAARLPAVDCVIAAGVPTDFQAYFAKAGSGLDPALSFVADTIRKTFGETPEATAPWEPVRLAGQIDADVLLLHQVGDPIIPPEQVELFRSARPTTEAVELEAGDPAKPDEKWVHGALSATGRSHYTSAFAAFADRAVASHQVARRADRTRCKGANRRLARTGLERFRRVLRCLARRDARVSRSRRARRDARALRRTTRTRMQGEVTPARAWAALRGTRTGRAQLQAVGAGRARVSVRVGDPSVLAVRAQARRRSSGRSGR